MNNYVSDDPIRREIGPILFSTESRRRPAAPDVAGKAVSTLLVLFKFLSANRGDYGNVYQPYEHYSYLCESREFDKNEESLKVSVAKSRIK